jgi:hypothetical protein
VKRLYAGFDPVLRARLEEALGARGIPYVVRNQFLSGAAGELPPAECWPEVWVIEDADLPAARRVLDGLMAEAPAEGAWRCPDCGECVAPAFELCWRCGAARPGPDRRTACAED